MGILFLDKSSTKTEKVLHWIRLGLIVSLNIVSGILFGIYFL